MLTPPMPETDDPFEMLMACHARIRLHCELVRQLVQHAGPTDAQVRDAAERAHRYFSVALPLHAGDEDLLLAPLVSADPALKAGFEALAGEHAAIHAALPEVLPTLARLAEAPGELADCRAAFGAPALHLTALLEAHLVGEETTLFPAARALLSAEQRAQMAADIRARRA
jgi:hypothetical protein